MSSLFPNSRGNWSFGRNEVGLTGVDGLLKWTSRGDTQLLFFSSPMNGDGALMDLGDGGGGKKLPPMFPTLDILCFNLASEGCSRSGEGFLTVLPATGSEEVLEFLSAKKSKLLLATDDESLRSLFI